MPDGRYELRLTASDETDNVPDDVKTARRLSAPVVVDNTAPSIEELTIRPGPQAGQVSISAQVSDAVSVIRDVRYAVDGGKRFKAVLPTDLIYDSTSEQVSFIIPDLSPGTHVITLRAADALGNARFESATAKVAKE
jgi:hypothetical protein